MILKDCIKELNTIWTAKGLICTILGPRHPHGSYTLEFESNEKLGTISLWDNGYLDAIILDKVGDQKCQEHYQLKTKSEFQKSIEEIHTKHLERSHQTRDRQNSAPRPSAVNISKNPRAR